MGWIQLSRFACPFLAGSAARLGFALMSHMAQTTQSWPYLFSFCLLFLLFCLLPVLAHMHSALCCTPSCCFCYPFLATNRRLTVGVICFRSLWLRLRKISINIWLLSQDRELSMIYDQQRIKGGNSFERENSFRIYFTNFNKQILKVLSELSVKKCKNHLIFI